MRATRYLVFGFLILVTAVLSFSACAGSGEESSIRVVVADDQEQRDGLAPGAPLANGMVRLFAGDALVLEQPLGNGGQASIAPPVGSYTVQVFLTSADPGCFWGNTIYEIAFPQPDLQIDAFQICTG